MGTAGTTSTSNAANTMGTTADAGAALPEDTTGATGAGTTTVVTRTGAGSAGAPGSIDKSIATAAMVGTTDAGTAPTTGTAIQANKTDENQASIILTAPNANLAKDIHKTPTHKKICIASHINAFLIQY